MINKTHKLSCDVVFPEGLAPGSHSLGNRQMIAVNGLGEAVLRGTALCGVLRHAYAEFINASSSNHKVSQWFGAALDGELDNPSCVQVTDCTIQSQGTVQRTHIMVNRHTGAVTKNALFEMEALPPQSSARLEILINEHAEDTREIHPFIEALAQILTNGLLVGGRSNRGIGRMVLQQPLHHQSFNLNELDHVARWLDLQQKQRLEGIQITGTPIEAKAQQNKLNITLQLAPARGEDFLIADSMTEGSEPAPQKTPFSNGNEHWKIPGSSLRGLFKSWMSRLAALDGYQLCDSSERWYQQYADEPSEYKADQLAWGFIPEDQRKEIQQNPDLLNDPIYSLFGSMYKKGRIHFSDAYTQEETDNYDTQLRKHVAIDRFSGGGNDGALFSNQVYTNQHKHFEMNISIINPDNKELQWLIKTLRALHLGILRVGSSKSSGHLEIKSIQATGQHSEHIHTFSKEIL